MGLSRGELELEVRRQRAVIIRLCIAGGIQSLLIFLLTFLMVRAVA